MACDTWRDRRIAYVYQDHADEAERLAVEAHLESCAPCRDDVTGLMRAREALRSSAPLVPAMPHSPVVAARPSLRPALAFAAGLGLAAVLVGAGMASGYWLASRGPRQAAPASAPQTAGLPASDAAPSPEDFRRAVMKEVDERLAQRDRDWSSRLARVHSPDAVTADDLQTMFAAYEKRADQRRESDIDYLLGEIGAAELRTGASIGETQRALQVVALANNPSATLH